MVQTCAMATTRQRVIVIGQELGQTHHFKSMPGRLEDAAVHQRLVSKKRRTRVLGAILAFNFPLKLSGCVVLGQLPSIGRPPQREHPISARAGRRSRWPQGLRWSSLRSATGHPSGWVWRHVLMIVKRSGAPCERRERSRSSSPIRKSGRWSFQRVLPRTGGVLERWPYRSPGSPLVSVHPVEL